MKKILIALNSRIVAADFQKRIPGCYEVMCCHNGTDALYLLDGYRPDVLVIDVMLDYLDGFSVIKAANAAGIYPRVIALTDFLSDYITDVSENLNVSHMFRYGSGMNAITASILELAESEEMRQSTSACIQELLIHLGFHMNTSGAAVIQTALEVYIQDPAQNLISQLYPKVAEICKGTPSQVERAIRTTVKRTWEQCNDALWRLYFAVGKNGNVARPKNGDFLARMSRCVENMLHSNEQSGMDSEKAG